MEGIMKLLTLSLVLVAIGSPISALASDLSQECSKMEGWYRFIKKGAKLSSNPNPNDDASKYAQYFDLQFPANSKGLNFSQGDKGFLDHSIESVEMDYERAVKIVSSGNPNGPRNYSDRYYETPIDCRTDAHFCKSVCYTYDHTSDESKDIPTLIEIKNNLQVAYKSVRGSKSVEVSQDEANRVLDCAKDRFDLFHKRVNDLYDDRDATFNVKIQQSHGPKDLVDTSASGDSATHALPAAPAKE